MQDEVRKALLEGVDLMTAEEQSRLLDFVRMATRGRKQRKPSLSLVRTATPLSRVSDVYASGKVQ